MTFYKFMTKNKGVNILTNIFKGNNDNFPHIWLSVSQFQLAQTFLWSCHAKLVLAVYVLQYILYIAYYK